MSKRKKRDGYSERLSVSFTAEQMRRLEELLRVRARQDGLAGTFEQKVNVKI